MKPDNPKTRMYTNGIERKRFPVDRVPDGWVFSPKIKSEVKYNHYTNGIDYKMIKVGDPIPDGWYKGLPEARKAKIRVNSKGIKKSDHWQKAIRNYYKENKLVWYTDGISADGRFIEGEQPKGWIKGQSPTRRAKNSTSNIGKKMSEESAKKRVATRFANGTYEVKESTRKLLSEINTGKKMDKKVIDKILDTKKANNTFNRSTIQDRLSEYLKSLYPDTVVEYDSDPRYPFNCDFYIPQFDLFIELNGHWTHGEHPFDPECELDQLTLEKWKSKCGTYVSKTGKEKQNSYYNAIKVWTELDPLKLKSARDNKLNYVAFYNIKNFSAMNVIQHIDFSKMRGIYLWDINEDYKVIGDYL